MSNSETEFAALREERYDRDKSNVFVGGRHRAAPRLQVVPEMVDALHRGVTGEAPVTVIAFYAGTEGMSLSK